LLHEQMDGVIETLLVFAARRDHLDRVIVPALARGDTVLCDRFTDATFAYQGAGRGQDERMLRDLEGWVHAGLQPDLTLWFDVDPAIAASRRAKARVSDRFESEDAAFFARVRDGYAARMLAAPARFCRIDSALEKSAVERQIDDAVAALEGRRR
jgi:dTMP kinase